MTTIEKGMYVRTKYGIAKVIDVKLNAYLQLDKSIMLCNLENYMDCCTNSDIIGEPSFDIIDVIEKGDLVNRQIVIKTGYNAFDNWCVSIEEYDGYVDYIYPHEIETILTKEQYESMCYEVKREDIN